MAGHSKWANIQHRKKAQDKKRAKVFTRLIREITVAARMGGSDPDANPRLRLAWDKALAANMPKDNIERAAKRGAGEDGADNYEESRYGGYGPQGAAIMVDCMTDNRNRTVSEIRYVFSRNGGNMGADGSVAYLFDAFDAEGNKRDSYGGLAQVTYTAGKNKFGLNYGISYLDTTEFDEANPTADGVCDADAVCLFESNQKVTAGYYYSFTPNLTLTAEYSYAESQNHAGDEYDANNVNVGAFFSF